MEETSGLQNFLEIVTKPDNIPIVGMLILVIFFTWLGMTASFQERQAHRRRQRRRNPQRNVEIVMAHKWLARAAAVLAFASRLVSPSPPNSPLRFLTINAGNRRARILPRAKPPKLKPHSRSCSRNIPTRPTCICSWACRYCGCAIPRRRSCRSSGRSALIAAHVDARTLLGYVELEVRGDIRRGDQGVPQSHRAPARLGRSL